MGHNRILVVGDDVLAGAVRAALAGGGWDAEHADSGVAALKLLPTLRPDVVFADACLPGLDAITLIGRVLALEPDAKIIVMVGNGARRRGVEAMKAGACDYLTMPLDVAELQLRVGQALQSRRSARALSFYRSREAGGAGLAALLGSSAPMQAMKSALRERLEAEARLPADDLPAVLIEGETGVGKAFVARALHVDGVGRDGPFVAVDCASMASQQLEAELFGDAFFGAERGARPDAGEAGLGLVEVADGGTLFLDAIGELDLALQSTLLRVLETRSVRRIGSETARTLDLRIVAATHRDLRQMVRKGTFRRDLYARLHTTTIRVPPLRERGDDIVALAEHFLSRFGRRYGKPDLYFDGDALAVLQTYAWPGNVRELRNVLEQTVLLARGRAITPNQLAICPGLFGTCDRDFQSLDTYCMSLPASGVSVPDVERDLVVKMLDRTDWNVAKTARLLGLTRDMLRYRIEKLGLTRPGN